MESRLSLLQLSPLFLNLVFSSTLSLSQSLNVSMSHAAQSCFLLSPEPIENVIRFNENLNISRTLKKMVTMLDIL